MEEQEKKTRIRALHIVLVVSFIGNGMSLASNVFMSIPAFRDFVRASMPLMPEVFHETYETMLSISPWYYMASSLFFAIALYGAILMWRLRGMGFHYYTLSKLLLIGAPLLFIGRQYLNLGDAMMSLLFVAFYYFSLRSLGIFGKKTDSNTESDHDSNSASNTEESDQE